MIREIAAKAGGAQIKIMSDKQSERGETNLSFFLASLSHRTSRLCCYNCWKSCK